MSKGQTKNRENSWKTKAICRREENERLRKRIKELTASRDNWKEKYKCLKQSSNNIRLAGEKASRHQYSVLIIGYYSAVS